MDEILATPMTRGGLRLMDVPRRRRLNELEFYLPIGLSQPAMVVTQNRHQRQLQLAFPDDGHQWVQLGRLTVKRLVEVFRRFPSAKMDDDYLQRLAALEFVPLEGYIKGFIDLVFQH